MIELLPDPAALVAPCPPDLEPFEGGHRVLNDALIALSPPPGSPPVQLVLNGVEHDFPMQSEPVCLSLATDSASFEYGFASGSDDFPNPARYLGQDLALFTNAPPQSWILNATIPIGDTDRPVQLLVPDTCRTESCPLVAGGDAFAGDLYGAHVAGLIQAGRVQPVVLMSVMPNFMSRQSEYVLRDSTLESFETHEEAFSSFLMNALQTYEINAPDAVSLFGFSNSAQFALDYAARHPDLVNDVLAISPYYQSSEGAAARLAGRTSGRIVYGAWEPLDSGPFQALTDFDVRFRPGGHSQALAAVELGVFLEDKYPGPNAHVPR